MRLHAKKKQHCFLPIRCKHLSPISKDHRHNAMRWRLLCKEKRGQGHSSSSGQYHCASMLCPAHLELYKTGSPYHCRIIQGKPSFLLYQECEAVDFGFLGKEQKDSLILLFLIKRRRRKNAMAPSDREEASPCLDQSMCPSFFPAPCPFPSSITVTPCCRIRPRRRRWSPRSQWRMGGPHPPTC